MIRLRSVLQLDGSVRSWRQAETLATAVRLAFPGLGCWSAREEVFVEVPVLPGEATQLEEAGAYLRSYASFIGAN